MNRFGKNVKVVHFLGSLKPWHYGYNVSSGQVSLPSGGRNLQELEHIKIWWDLFVSHVKPNLNPECVSKASN